jgi:hypothetical protein
MSPDKIKKLANDFVSRSLFEEPDLRSISKELALLSGKLFYTSKNMTDAHKAKKAKEAARLILIAADMLK